MPKGNKKRSTGKAYSPSKDTVVFCGKDWYGTLASATTDTTASLGILNPFKNNTLFERASKVSQDFAMFRFKTLRFRFRGMSPSTSKGSLAFCAVITNGFGGGLAVSNEASVKNTEHALILRGDKSGTYNVKCNSQWLAMDTNAAANSVGNSMGTLYHFIDGTVAAADLTWDVTVEYVIEFRSPVRPGTVDVAFDADGSRPYLEPVLETLEEHFPATSQDSIEAFKLAWLAKQKSGL